MPYPALASSGAAPAVSRRDKFLLAGVAMMSASAIAVTPVAQNTTVIEQAKSLAYDLTASMDAAASPVDVYGSLFETTFDNLQSLGGAVAANPAPLLSQILENQMGYAEKFGAAFEAIPANLKAWYEGANGQARLDQALAELQAGNIGEAYRWFNHSMLYAFQGAFGALIAPGFILSGVPRGGTEYLAGIPEQMAQNFTNLVAATLTSSVVVSALFQGAFATVSGPAFELARIAESISTSVAAGDMEGVFNAVVNTPGILVNAALNGFDYADPDESGAGGFTEWPALLTWAEPGEQGGARIVAGLLQNLLVNIPKTLADAIDNTPEAPSATVAQRVAAALSGSPTAALAESTVDSVKEKEAAGALESGSVEQAPALESGSVDQAPALESSKTPAAAVQAVKVEKPVAEAAPVVAEEAAAGSETAPAAGAETAPAAGSSVSSVSSEGTTKANDRVKITDRIKAKVKEAKDARQAKVTAAKEAKAAKVKAKQTKASESKASDSKGGSDSSE
ncbi:MULTISPECIES: hypothetical protein [Mycolicibacterium]|uniref:PE-PGRS family protein n=1 Tax=Mycolicibacterium senegalense TaxID=1796 RepID=A0A378WBJ2_9MYCO|nr:MULTISPECIES: hypothetical protein [Mycolicibacterium]MDR7292613.1 hypothetical protein [Mycolicibacterium senegalense]CDP88165.1 PE-PGRS family protein [Mycolicibacterium farcinogenes]SUA29601.1 PE-PGRS family protein [Mycolicibacterium senegalense]